MQDYTKEKKQFIEEEYKTYLYNIQYLYGRIKQKKFEDTTKYSKLYRLLLEEESKLIKKIANGHDTIFTYFTIFHYLLINGWFSVDKTFNFGEDKNEDLVGYLSSTIVEGSGVCRNIACKFNEIINKLSPEYFTCLIGVDSNYFTKERKLEDFKIDHGCSFLMPINNKDGLYWVLDPTNFILTRLTQDAPNKGVMYNFLTSLMYPNNLWNTIKTEEETKKSIEDLKDLSLRIQDLGSIILDKKTTEDLRNYGINLCKDNMDTIIQYRKETDNLYKETKNIRQKTLTKWTFKF